MKLQKIACGFLFFVSILTGCMTTARHQGSSVVQYLYPDKNEPIDSPAIPALTLPLRAGIAFVPESAGNRGVLTESDKLDLMKEVSLHFKKYDFIKSIDLIPSAYLTQKGGFTNLDQIRTMFGIDVIALVSYDQSQFTNEGWTSITYWTLVGAYVVPGEKNDTHTMVDAAVYDIKSRKMLFRAPGVSHIKSRATPVNLSEQMRTDSMTGFRESSRQLITNLDEQLALFKERVKSSPQDFQVVQRPGYTGGGSLGLIEILLPAIMGGLYLWRRKRTA